MRQIPKAIALVFLYMVATRVEHSIGLITSNHAAYHVFGYINTAYCALLLLSAVLLFAGRRIGAFTAYAAFGITGVGLTHTSFYNGIAMYNSSPLQAMQYLKGHDIQFILLNAGVLAVLIVTHCMGIFRKKDRLANNSVEDIGANRAESSR
jgi:hypothetical protein